MKERQQNKYIRDTLKCLNVYHFKIARHGVVIPNWSMFVHGLSFFYGEYSWIMYDKPEWKFAMRKMEEIQNIIQIQNERISTLELQSEELCKLTVKDLQKIIKQQNDRIARLETRVEDLYKLLTTAEHEPGLAREAIDASREENAMTRRSKIRKGTI